MSVTLNRPRRWLLLGLCWLILPGWARPLVVVGTPEPPFKMRLDGRVTGIDVDIVDRVLNDLNIDHEFVLVSSGTRLLREVDSGHVDLVMSLSYSPERAEFLDYPERSYKTVSWHFFVRENNLDAIRYRRLSDLKGWRVGAVQSWAYTPEFWAEDLDRKLVTDHRLLIDMLLTGRIDVAPLNTAETLFDIKQRHLGHQLTLLPNALTSRPYYNVFVKHSDHPELPRLEAEYDRLVQALESSGEIGRLYQRYLGRTMPVD